jgi:RNA 2',3'-cyclic 3'-phosphodiesterase
MDVVRTFVAVLLAHDLKEEISKVQEQVKKLAPDVKWVAPENFHVTMKFLGNVREDDLPAVFASADETVRRFEPFEMSVSGLGAFPNARNARVVWVGLEEGRQQLSEIARAVDEDLDVLGFEREDKPFKAHITIGRVKESRFLDGLAKGIGEVRAENLGVQNVSEIVIMKSDLLRGGPVYSPLHVCRLS